MLVLITYDVSTETVEGRRRLSKMAKACLNYGQRVQNSVFECVVDSTQLVVLRSKLLECVDKSADSLRIYVLGNSYKDRVEHYGVKPSVDFEGTLIV